MDFKEMNFNRENLDINKWKFETGCHNSGDEKKLDYLYFWWGMYFHGIYWGLMTMANILGFELLWVIIFCF